MKTRHSSAGTFALLMTLSLGVAAVTAQEARVDRTELPIKGPWYPPITTLDARDAKAPPVFEVKAPKGAPNVVVILLDDLGFGGTSATGGVIQTPHFDKLAKNGLLYNQFHTTALCSPTRQALITGRNDSAFSPSELEAFRDLTIKAAATRAGADRGGLGSIDYRPRSLRAGGQVVRLAWLARSPAFGDGPHPSTDRAPRVGPCPSQTVAACRRWDAKCT